MKRISRLLVVVVGAALAIPGRAADQVSPSALAEGRHIRLWLDGLSEDMIEGRVVSLDDMVLILERPGRRERVPLKAVVKLQVSIGQKRHPVEGLLIGLAIGGVFAALQSDDASGCHSSGFFALPCSSGALVAQGALAGLATGFFFKTHQWGDITDAGWSQPNLRSTQIGVSITWGSSERRRTRP